MQVSFAAKHCDVPEEVKEYAEKKLANLKHFFEGIVDAHVTLYHEKRRYQAEMSIQANGITLHSTDEEADMKAAIDLVIKKMERQLKKYKDRIKNHRLRTQHLTQQAFKVDVLEGADVIEPTEEGPRVIKTSRYNIKPMSVEEAAMQMDLIEQDFLAFSNTRTGKSSVIYRRKDGHYGLIEPE